MPSRKQEILDAALAIADEQGIDAVTMRAVAKRVGLTPMALYGHIQDKEGLLDSMLGQLLSEISLPNKAGTWQERLTLLANEARGLAKRHPGAVALVFARPSIAPDAVRVVDAIYVALLDAGVGPCEVPRVERLVSTLVLGYATSEANGRFSSSALNPRGRRAQLPEGELPGHAALRPLLDEPVDWDAEFRRDLTDMMTLIESLARSAGRARKRDANDPS
jgi:AcrR family transcriptional regulator